ncbi:MAG: c-type cytochrome [Actinobacteria bacterium]|nr:c-type cytochrome [Actinomycetota bacterium]
MIRWTGIWVGLLAVLLVLTACGNGDANTTAPAATVGDPERGREIWDDGGGVITGECSRCHSLDGSEEVAASYRAPTWQGISGRAGDRVPGLSAEEYLRESIVDPAAYIVEGYSGSIMQRYKLLLSDEDIDNLVAFLLTL